MGILKEKSDKSYQSAVLLLSNGQYCNSVQCSYFSTLQLAKDRIIEKLAKGDPFIENLKNSKASHVDIINKASQLSKSRNDTAKINELMNDLKRKRKNAIYDEFEVFEHEANDAIGKVETINQLLKKI